MSKFLSMVFLLLFCVTAFAGTVRLEKDGLKVDLGPAGGFLLRYPVFQEKQGKSHSPMVELNGDRAVLTYPVNGTPRVMLSLAGNGTLSGNIENGKNAGLLRWTMHLPYSWNKTGEFSIPADSAGKKFPEKLIGDGGIARLNSRSAKLFETMTGSGMLFQSEQQCYWELLDNRVWKWNIFVLNFYWGADGRPGSREQRSFSLKTFSPEKIAPGVDRFGQPVKLDFPGKIKNEAELKADVDADRDYYRSLNPPKTADFGGDPSEKLQGTGFFRVARHNQRLILVTPAGNPFFQLGVCTMGPCDDYTYVKGREQIYEWLPDKNDPLFRSAYKDRKTGDSFSFYLANRIRKSGKPYDHDQWRDETISRLRKWGFNSQGAFCNDLNASRRNRFPCTPSLPMEDWRMKPTIGQFFDPFDPTVRKKLDQNFSSLAKYADEPLIIGYFIHNEQHYGDLARQLPGTGENVRAKHEFVSFLKKKYGSVKKFNAAWQLDFPDFDAAVKRPLPVKTNAAWKDSDEFSVIFFEAYFKLIAETFRKYDPNHLLLGARFLPGQVNTEAATRACGKYSDVFSINYYTYNVDPAFLERAHQLCGKRPLLLSEWSYGTSEQGLSGGVVDVSNQTERGKAYRNYVEQTASLPFVVGTQFFANHDQALTGRYFQKYSGESMNVGLVNVADRPFKEFLAYVMAAHYHIYDIVNGKTAPYKWENGNVSGRKTQRSLQIPRAMPGHKVDGLRTPWPGRPAERIDATQLVAGKNSGGMGADFWLCWDSDHLYLFIEVDDPTPNCNPNGPTHFWNGDCIEIFVGADDVEKTGRLLFSDRQLLISAALDGGVHWQGQQEHPPVMRKIFPRADGKGYTLEAGIPWKALGIENPQAGRKIRFNLGLDDGDGGNRRQRQFMWSGNGSSASDRTNWGMATLVD